MTTPHSTRLERRLGDWARAREQLQTLARFPERIDPAQVETAQQLLQRLDGGPLNCVFGAFAGDDLVGTAGFIVPDRSAKSRHKGLLVGVHVAPAHRGRALGRRRVAAVIDHARAHVVLLQAGVGVTNAPALRLYESLGFRHYGREDKALRVDGVFIDEALIVLDFAGDT